MRRSLERWKEMGPAGATLLVDGEAVPVKTQAHAKRFFGEILDRYEPREMVTQQHDHQWLLWLIGGHYDYRKLCPAGAEYFTVHSSRDIGHIGTAKGFSVVAEGATTSVPFSVMRSLRGTPNTSDEKVELAMARSVESSLMRWFDVEHAPLSRPIGDPSGRRRCPVTGEDLVEGENLYIHYAVSMAWLIEGFCASEGIFREELDAKAIDCGDHFDWEPVFDRKDPFVSAAGLEKWRNYHWDHMEIRYTSVVGHFQLEKRRIERERRDDNARKAFMGLRTPLNYNAEMETG